jgi:phosphoribosyl-ATP pyrophosphohydrolase/phosphoribosyl-AMP cyclohydrolase
MTAPRSPAGPEVRFPPDGLVPAIVQDAVDGRVLMLAWMDAEALAATLESGDVHFHSRSRDRLWHKGETSGNVLRLVDISVDCDGDAVLVTVDPAGPTCHRGTRSCFDALGEPGGSPGSSAGTPDAVATQGFAWLETLWATIAQRAATRPEGSYTAALLDGGVDAVGRIMTEEATEVLIAAKDDAAFEATGADRTALRDALAGEAGDLVFHTLVLLAERNLPASDVIDRLRTRHRR